MTSPVGFINGIMAAYNGDFSGSTAASLTNGLIANGKMWIGSTAVNANGTYINVGTITSPLGTLTIGYSSPNITMDLTGGGTAVEHLTGNTGGSLNPDGSNNFNLLGTGSLTNAGSGSTLTMQLTGLTNHAVLVGAGTATITKIAATANTGAILQNNSGADPSYSTSTYPSTNAQGDLIYGSAANALSTLAKDTNSTRYLSNTGSSNNPAWAQVALATGVSGQLPLANGGTNANLTASNGGIFYSTATAGAILSGTATANQILVSGASTTPAWSTATYPVTTTSQQILYSSATNVIGQLATANSKFPATNSSGTLAMRAFSVVVQVFTGSGTYTPTTGMLYCTIEVVGAGGGGAGAATTTSTQVATGGGGGGGGYARKTVAAATIGASQTVTIGAGGGGGSGNAAGTAGGTTSVGAIVSATGGGGGLNGAAAIVSSCGGGSGGAGSSGDINISGGSGHSSCGAFVTSADFTVSGFGGISALGAGAGSAGGTDTSGNGGGGQSYGSGASGAVNGHSNGATKTGGTGANGVVVITEFVIA